VYFNKIKNDIRLSYGPNKEKPFTSLQKDTIAEFQRHIISSIDTYQSVMSLWTYFDCKKLYSDEIDITIDYLVEYTITPLPHRPAIGDLKRIFTTLYKSL